MGIELLDPRNKADVEGVVALRSQCFPEEPVGLRYHLWRNYIYTDLVNDHLMQCAIARKDGKVAGFVTYTKHPNTYLAIGRRRHLLHLGWTVLSGLLTPPEVAGNLRWLLIERGQIDQVLRPPQLPPGTGEVLMLAVDPSAQAWVPEGGTSRVSLRLIDTALQYFELEQMREVFFLVRGSNTASNLLCHSLGCRMEKVGEGDLVYHHFYYSFDGDGSS